MVELVARAEERLQDPAYDPLTDDRGYFGRYVDQEFDPEASIANTMAGVSRLLDMQQLGSIDTRLGLHPWGACWLFLNGASLEDSRINQLAALAIPNPAAGVEHLSALAFTIEGQRQILPDHHQSRMRTYPWAENEPVKLHAKEHIGYARNLMGTSLYFSASDA